jgi:hypothetical protein
VRLLAEAGVREDLEHVDEAALRAVEPVLAVAVAVEPAQDRDLAHRQIDRAVAVVEHELDLGRRPRLHALAAAEDDVLHRLAAHRQRRLLTHRPQDGVGDVRLARAVRAHHHRHARAELELRPVGEGLEALERERLQVHRCLLSRRRACSGEAPAPSGKDADPNEDVRYFEGRGRSLAMIGVRRCASDVARGGTYSSNSSSSAL